MPHATRSQPPTLRDELRQVLRLDHSPLHTERSSGEWSVRCVHIHGIRSRRDAPWHTHHDTRRGALWGVACRQAAARHEAAAQVEWLHSL
jgi:hypothetical protein